MAATVVRYLRSVGSLPSAAAEPGTEPVEALPRPDLRAVGEDERAPVSPAEFRAVLGNFASGVTIITSPPGEDEDGPAGFACQSFASLSLDPPLVTFMVARTSTTWPRIARTGVFCVNILGAEQGELCRAFAVSGADKFAGVAHTPAPATGSPQLEAVPAWIDCRIHAVHTGGDHLIVVGRVEAMGAAGEGEPLLFHKGRFGRFTD
ncbi:flavin reductase family protein [Streptomyces sp. AP-93]|uniref:flavin reductase family protein n=1 Tax=Streptomyces sp. AP-93 TaxID=2929048 RepID=UPI001FAF41F7|nr:flavin reductase family protein [Streptomyces sp. AP-93]MCJ0873530.1 flavin reductase family protein [Streptomyces sp. AP-93]